MKRILIFSALIIFIGIMTTFAYYGLYIHVKTIVIPADVQVTTENRAGFNADTDAVHFGVVRVGRASWRPLEVKSTWDFPVTVHLEAGGFLGPYITFDNESFVLQPGQEVVVKAHLQAPTEPGNYTGTVTGTYLRT
ncbi:hypothetical protein GF342_04465 [Candidatus Woesearchaeota archaeon]|nr:hypothetical protein [Candidatus Woesearchaeota archaeon]